MKETITRTYPDGTRATYRLAPGSDAAAPVLLAALELLLNVEGAALHGARLPGFVGLDVAYHFAAARAAIAAATVVEAPHHPDCPATDGFGCHCDELGPWEHEPQPATYDDDYPVEDPQPSPADADRAARAWEADRLTRGEP